MNNELEMFLKDAVKGEVVPVLYLIKYYAMKTHGGVDVLIHIFVTSALVGGEWSAPALLAGKEPPIPIG
jgi:hypothetical protein